MTPPESLSLRLSDGSVLLPKLGAGCELGCPPGSPAISDSPCRCTGSTGTASPWGAVRSATAPAVSMNVNGLKIDIRDPALARPPDCSMRNAPESRRVPAAIVDEKCEGPGLTAGAFNILPCFNRRPDGSFAPESPHVNPLDIPNAGPRHGGRSPAVAAHRAGHPQIAQINSRIERKLQD